MALKVQRSFCRMRQCCPWVHGGIRGGEIQSGELIRRRFAVAAWRLRAAMFSHLIRNLRSGSCKQLPYLSGNRQWASATSCRSGQYT